MFFQFGSFFTPGSVLEKTIFGLSFTTLAMPGSFAIAAGVGQ